MVVSKQQCDSLPGQQGHSHFHFFQQQSDNRAARSSRTRPGKLVGSCQQVFVNNSFPSGLYILNQCFSREPKRSRGRSEGAKARGSGGRVEVGVGKGCLLDYHHCHPYRHCHHTQGRGAGQEQRHAGQACEEAQAQERRKKQMRRAQSEAAINKKVRLVTV